MASNGYPKVTLKAWRALRSRAAAAPSTKFTPATVAALMGMSSPKSAGDNTVYPMRRLGLIDEEGALTDRGDRWRVDGSYAEACQEILDEIYPSDLSVLTEDSGAPDPHRVRTWFDHRGFGESNARQMAATYVMIASKEVPESLAADVRKVATTKAATRNHATATSRTTSTPERLPSASTTQSQAPLSGAGPNVHLDIQIHIPADASAKQIDQIFESMARHLYKQ